MIEVKPYSKEFEEQHIAFAQKYWTKKRRFTPEYIYWKFRGAENKPLNSFILAFDGDQVVGQFGVVPSEISIDGVVYQTQWACDLMVDTNYRGKGVAEKLYEFAHENCIITLGSDPSPAAEKSMLKKGYISILGPRKFIFPVKVGEIFKLKGYNSRFLNTIPNPFVLLLKCFSANAFSEIESKEFFHLKSNKIEPKIHCSYDESFIDWRFSSFKNYYNGIECYQKNATTFFCGYFVNGIYYLTDFNVKHVFQFLSIIGFICKKYKNDKLVRIKFLSNTRSISLILPFLGFIRFRTLTKVILFSKEKSIREKAFSNTFYYTLFDSDENI
ncbi:MAG: GNAT family N-acetyltransferase [Bacteroidota bacterium]